MNLEDGLRATLRSEAQGDLPSGFVSMVLARLPARGRPRHGLARAAALTGLATVVLAALAVGSWLVQSWPGRSPFGDTTLDAPTPTPTSSPPGASPAPSLTPTPSLAGLPPPPDSFDPRSIRWVGDAASGTIWGNYENGIAIAAIDGSGYRNLAEGLGLAGSVLPDGRVLYLRPKGDTYDSDLVLVDAESREARVLSRVAYPYAVALQDEAVYGVRLQAEGLDAGRDDGLWRIPLDGSTASLILPAVEGWVQHYTVAVSTDGQTVVLRRANEGASSVQAQFRGSSIELPQDAKPVGIDLENRLIYGSGEGLERLDLHSGARATLAAFASDLAVQARVSADGTRLLTWLAIEGGRDQELRAIDLRDLTQRSWWLDGIWVLTGLGGSRYAVLEGVPPGETSPGWHAIIDLEEGWLGFLPPIKAPGT